MDVVEYTPKLDMFLARVWDWGSWMLRYRGLRLQLEWGFKAFGFGVLCLGLQGEGELRMRS